ncbi:hotdog fold thioesterase [Filimonas effusa]|uniref:Hotdog fold thioesterase n=1 Tax=Filimonas effusa TaxID=2508721 RepID=A0A4Q1DAJ0_9BACT|nr:hotdog fold thioesterase [Filimonas effusa]RXK85573.1 hotdog fold thioesterase [Filimonas effusa]
MAIWFKEELSLDDFTALGRNTLAEVLGMRFSEIGPDYLKLTMPVNDRTRQPYGLLHGGASAALAETAGSVASAMVIDLGKFSCVGLEINANHIRGVRDGIVTATCQPLHLGKQTHVWDIKIHDEQQRLVCISRLTVSILPRLS